MDGVRVYECDLEPEQALSWRLVDEVGPRVGELGESGVEIAHLVGDVVHPRPALGEEAADGSVFAERLEQLDAALADPERGGPNALILHRCAMLDFRSEQALVRGQSGVEIVDRNSEMVDPPRLHGSDAIHS